VAARAQPAGVSIQPGRRTIEQDASSIMSSVAHGRIAEMPVGLIAVAV
jgi:hypothetical protein